MTYAAGNHGHRFICQRCGFPWEIRYQRKEWTGEIVCPECYDVKHPQLTLPRVKNDILPLRHPFPREWVGIGYVNVTMDAVLT